MRRDQNPLCCTEGELQKICLRTMKSRHCVASAVKYHMFCVYLHGVMLSVALTIVSDIKQPHIFEAFLGTSCPPPPACC